MVPMAQIEKEFEAANPDIDVEIQAHGSIQVIRHLTELGEDVDIVAVADYSLIPLLMYQTMMPDGKPYGSWYIKPATNQLVNNWYDIITRPDVRMGLADPRMDAVGYRTLMVTKLAESFYGVKDIMRNAVGKYFSTPISAIDLDSGTLITVPELLEPSADRIYLRGASMQCIALLQSGDIDYTFEYKSVVAQQGLNYLELPPQINLGDKNYTENYRTVKVKLDFRRFKSVTPEFAGLPIEYGISIANNSQKQEAAVRFLLFILGPDGQRIFNDNHHPPLIPPECDNIEALPDLLKPLFK
jgi:molybdate/tungstate transport system substrate-binding protein